VIEAYFSANSYHTRAITLNLVDSAIARNLTTNAIKRITTINQPLPPTQVSTVAMSVVFNDVSVWFQPYIITFVQTFGLAIVVAWFPIFVARERITKMKHLQVVDFGTFRDFGYVPISAAPRRLESVRTVAGPYDL
jgi:hypothetical protein